MHFIIAITPVNPVRAKASHKAEMVSQMLFGETAQVLEEHTDFYKVRCTADNYEGWIQRSQVCDIPAKFFRKKIKGISAENRAILFNNEAMQLPMGSVVWNTKNIGKYPVSYSRVPLNTDMVFNEENIIAVSKKYLNTSYLWGGRSTGGIDCSGFSQQVFRILNIQLPRDAYQQAEVGEVIGFLTESRYGDLAFFDNEEGRIVHVGILIDSKTIIHSMGKVRIDKIDTEGIINMDTGVRTHHLRIIKRINNQIKN